MTESKRPFALSKLAIVSTDMRPVCSASHGNAMQRQKMLKRGKIQDAGACEPATLHEIDSCT